MTVLHRLLAMAQGVGVPVGRWPDPASLTFHLRKLFRQYRVDMVLDVGAHRGEYAELLRQDVRYEGAIVSFEPAQATFVDLQRRASKDSRWRAEHVALGAESGTATLQHYFHSQLNSLRTPSDFGSDVWHLRAVEFEEVPVLRLDECDVSLEDYTAPFLKIDTQGYDYQVLRGAAGILHRVVALQLEVPMIPLYEGAADFSGMLKALADIDFAVSGLFPVAHDAKLRAVEFDCVAVREQ